MGLKRNIIHLYGYLRHFTNVAFSSFRTGQIDALKYQSEHGYINLNGVFTTAASELLEGSFLQTFIPQTKAGSVPEEYLALVAALIEEHEQVPAVRVLAHYALGKHRETVEAASHIRRRGVYEYPDSRRQRQHGLTSRRAINTRVNKSICAQ